MASFVEGLDKYVNTNITWKNLDPTGIMNTIEKTISLGATGQLLRRVNNELIAQFIYSIILLNEF